MILLKRYGMNNRAMVFAVFIAAIGMAAPLHAAENAASPAAGVLTIGEGIQRVLKDSRLIKIAYADNEMALQDALAARSALLPHLSAFVTETYLQNQPGAKFDAQQVNSAERESGSYGVDLYQTLFDFGKTVRRYKASREAMHAQRARAESVKRLAVLDFVVGYFDLLEAQQMVTVAEKEVESLQSYLSDITHMYEQGTAVKNDLLPAQVRLADAQQKLIAARNYRTSAASSLKNILTIPLTQTLDVRDIEMQEPRIPALEEAWKISQEQRPEIIFMNDQIRASALREKSLAAGNMPELYAEGGYSYADNQYQVHQGNSYVNLGAKVQLYDGGLTHAQAFRERAQQGQLRQQRDKLVDDVKFEVQNSYLGVNDAREALAVAMDARAQANENVRVNRVKYAEGAATTTDVLEAIAMQTTAQTNFYSSSYRLKRLYAKLMYAMGIDISLMYENMGRGSDGPAHK